MAAKVIMIWESVYGIVSSQERRLCCESEQTLSLASSIAEKSKRQFREARKNSPCQDDGRPLRKKREQVVSPEHARREKLLGKLAAGPNLFR
jgi:hypothetical protein